MEEFIQDRSQEEEGTVFMMQLLMEEQCEIPEKSEIEAVIKKHLGDETDCFGYGEDIASIAVNKYKIDTEEGQISPMLSIFKCMELDSTRIDAMTRAQMWDCPEHEEILEKCKFQVLASDMLSSIMYYNERADMLMDFMEALVELFPTCKAVYFVNSGKMFTADKIRSHKIEHDDRFIYFSVNVRFFRLSGTEDMIVDTVGMDSIYMPDLQYHFHGADPNHVVNHAYNMLSYMYANENPIRNGNVIDGVENGSISPNIQWRCNYEESLIQPMRAVIDINMGELASGARE